MTPLERAGKALYERDPLTQDAFRRDCLNPNDKGTARSEPLPWEDLGQDDRDAYIADARAVIEAIREPSEAMLHRADGVEIAPWSSGWTAMINALLEEGQA